VSEKPVAYGGQAVIEGVMFGGRYVQVTAIRRKDGSIETWELVRNPSPFLSFLKKIPLIRGIVALIEASTSGAKHLQFATERYDLDDSDEESRQEDRRSPSKLTTYIGVAAVGVLSLVIGKILFTALPAFLASVLFDRYVHNLFAQNLIEGGIKTLLLLAYLILISQTPTIKRVFQYHGAEHKVINAYEAGVELTIRNVQRQSTLHYRCGSSFIILTVLVGVIVYSFIPYDNVWDRIGIRLMLLPVVVGLSYELLKLTNALRNVPGLSYLGYPGLWLQKLTTRQPDDDQVEVAIAAFNKMRELDLQTEATVASSSLAHSRS
jgi:uncharacterized protein YqhQ